MPRKASTRLETLPRAQACFSLSATTTWLTPRFEASQRTLKSGVANEIFGIFEQKYPLTRDEFTKQMLESKGNLNSLEAALSLKEGSVDAAIASGKEKTGEEKYKIASESKIDTLRAQLRERLSAEASAVPSSDSIAAQGMKRETASASAGPKREMDFHDLANDSNPVAALSPETDAELTIFDVVHKKYAEKHRFFAR
jgi:hypothetical protein